MKKINQKVSEEFSKGNFEFAFPHFADDIKWNVVGASAIKGKDEVIAHCKKMQVEMAGSTLTNTKHTIGEDSIATEGYCNYENDGKPGRVEYCDVYRFAEDKLQQITSYCIEIKQE